MSKLPYGMLIVMICCVGAVFAQQQSKKTITPEAKEMQRLQRVVDLSKIQVENLRKKVADLEARIRKLEQHIAIEPGGSITIRATNLNIRASGRAEIRSNAPMDIRSSLLRVNGGGKPIARLGDQTAGTDYNGFPVITTITKVGPPTVLVP